MLNRCIHQKAGIAKAHLYRLNWPVIGRIAAMLDGHESPKRTISLNLLQSWRKSAGNNESSFKQPTSSFTDLESGRVKVVERSFPAAPLLPGARNTITTSSEDLKSLSPEKYEWCYFPSTAKVQSPSMPFIAGITRDPYNGRNKKFGSARIRLRMDKLMQKRGK